MGYGEKRGDYYRARYKIAPGNYGTLADAEGRTLRFRTKRAAEQAANDEEARIRSGKRRDPAAGRITFGEYASRWYGQQDLAASTMQNYRRHIEEHLLPAFHTLELVALTKAEIADWEQVERGNGYAASSIKTWRSTLHTILADAVDEGLLETNPGARRRGRGKRAGRSRNRAPEKVITDALGMLLIAERASLLSGRDEEFVGVVTKGYTGVRWGELVGLEPDFVRPSSLRVEWQLYELDTGELLRCPPKDDSYRDIDLPDFLSRLVGGLAARRRSAACACHGRAYVFTGHGAAAGQPRRTGATLADVARCAGVSAGTVSNVLNRPEAVREETRLRVEKAIIELGYVHHGAEPERTAPHWRRSSFGGWLFQPAATGRYPAKSPQPARPVPVMAEPWPGVPARGRGASARATACWTPIATGLTPHGLRHSHKAIMEELGTPPKLMDERLGHEDGSVQSRYSHVTPAMRRRLMEGLTEVWRESLELRRELSPHSPVAALDGLLNPRQQEEPGRGIPRSSPRILPKPPRKAVRSGLLSQKTGPELRFHQSGWRDLNPRPLRPERSALPSCATPRCNEYYSSGPGAGEEIRLYWGHAEPAWQWGRVS